MRRQTRTSYTRIKKRKYFIRRAMLLTLLLALIGGLTYLLFKIMGNGDAKIDTQALASPSDVASPTNVSVATQTNSIPKPTPKQLLSPELTVQKASGEALAALGYTKELQINKEEKTTYSREESISFGSDEAYTSVKGIITFGGNNYRNSFVYGTQEVEEKALARIWEHAVGSLTVDSTVWTGIGWTGMPLIVQWSDEVRETLGVFDEFKHKEGFTEVIYPAMDGYIYFYELSTGKQTRDNINLGVVVKGTASLDPRGYPMLYTGQGVMSTEGEIVGSWFRAVSLIENKEVWRFGGRDPYSPRMWQAFDSSALIDAKTDTLIVGGENGLFYSVKLNTVFDAVNGTISIDPGSRKLQKYKYDANGFADRENRRWWGIESSLAAWRNFAFFTDNGGLLQCIDLNTLEPQYVIDVLDNSDASVVIEESFADSTIYLYTANSVDKQSSISDDGLGKCYHRKINGLTGDVVWQVQWDASKGTASANGGTVSTPHVGRGNISDLVIFNQTLVPVTVNGEAMLGGRIIAYNKATGQEAWRYEQAAGYWSSPVVIYDEQNTAYLIQCDRDGIMRMHDAKNGAVLCEVNLGSRIESTPAIFDNFLVVGTRGQDGSGESAKIIGIRIK